MRQAEGRGQGRMSTVAVGRMARRRRWASQLVRRKQPWDSVWEIFSGAGVPWMP